MLGEKLDHLDPPTPRPEGKGWTPRRYTNLLETCYAHPFTIETNPKYDGGQLARLTVCPVCERPGYNPVVFARDGKLCFHCHSTTCSDKHARDLLERIAPDQLGTFILSGTDWAAQHHTTPDVLIEGILHRGEVVNLCAGPKARKSYFLIQLQLCFAFGLPWFGFATKPGRVLAIDNELIPSLHRKRFERVCNALNLDFSAAMDRIDLWSMRDDPKDVEEIERMLRQKRDYGIITLDALYKCYPNGVDENSNAGMMRVFRSLAKIAQSQDAAIIDTHHMAKGNDQYHSKSVTDLGAGAGAQSRSADSHIVLIPGENPNYMRVEGVLREFPPFDPFVIRNAFPLWVRDDEAEFEIRKSARPSNLTKDNFVTLLTGEDQPTKDVIAKAIRLYGGSKSAAKIIMGELAADEIVVVTPNKGNKPERIRKLPFRLVAMQ